ncbi:MAG: hypothetical protein FGM54_10995 [Chitinophagaceae bacterium]|nr:hypothetical protein [Chitinophagaceae bacterium]
MKQILFLFIALISMSFTLKAQTYSSGYSNYTYPSTRYQSGYYNNSGTYVQPHVKTTSNNTNWDNYSTSGNTNPYTGESGTKARDYSSGSYNYGSGQNIQTGSRGGQYYINSNGNKVYVPKR